MPYFLLTFGKHFYRRFALEFVEQFLSVPSVLLVGGLYLVCIVGLYAIRKFTEGFPYNNSLSSEIGDVLLILGFPGVSNWILTSNRYTPRSSDYCWLCAGFIAALVIGALFCRSFRQDTWADRYHAVIIGPLLAFLIGATIPIISAGLWYQWLIATGCFLTWALLVAYDGKTGRLQQTEFLKKLGFTTDQTGRLRHQNLI